MHDRHFFHRNYLVGVSVELLHICADDIKLRFHRKKGHLLQASVRERYIVAVHFHDIIAFTRLYALVVSLSNAHVLVYLNDMEKYTLAVGLVMLKASQGATLDMGPMMAAALIAVIPTFILYLTCQKYFVQGVVTSGLKG